MINRWVEEDGLLETLQDEGIGSIVFSPLAQGMLTSKYLGGVPADSRAAQGGSLRKSFLTPQVLANIAALNDLAQGRGQTLAQMALAWVLRDGRVTGALIGASRPGQITDCVGALGNLEFSDAELAQIDRLSGGADVNLWAASAERDGPSRQLPCHCRHGGRYGALSARVSPRA